MAIGTGGVATTLDKAATGLADDAFASRCDRAARHSYALAGYPRGNEAEERDDSEVAQ